MVQLVHHDLSEVMLCLKCQEMEKELKLNEVMALLTGAAEFRPRRYGLLLRNLI